MFVYSSVPQPVPLDGHVTVQPGTNDIPDGIWERSRRTPQAHGLITTRRFQAASEKQPTLAGLTPEAASAFIATVADPKALARWLPIEGRPAVKKAIQKRQAALKADGATGQATPPAA